MQICSASNVPRCVPCLAEREPRFEEMELPEVGVCRELAVERAWLSQVLQGTFRALWCPMTATFVSNFSAAFSFNQQIGWGTSWRRARRWANTWGAGGHIQHFPETFPRNFSQAFVLKWTLNKLNEPHFPLLYKSRLFSSVIKGDTKRRS